MDTFEANQKLKSYLVGLLGPFLNLQIRETLQSTGRTLSNSFD